MKSVSAKPSTPVEPVEPTVNLSKKTESNVSHRLAEKPMSKEANDMYQALKKQSFIEEQSSHKIGQNYIPPGFTYDNSKGYY
jgi:hypothetical protein